MADNSIVVPICVVKAYASSAIAAGDFVSNGDTGFNTGAKATMIGAAAYSPASASAYFALMICGVVKVKTGGAVYAGARCYYSDTCKVVAESDTAQSKYCKFTALDFASDSVTTKTVRMWCNGEGTPADSSYIGHV